jgi:hypothetical protein
VLGKLVMDTELAGAAHVPVTQAPLELWLPEEVQPQGKPLMMLVLATAPVQEAALGLEAEL